MEYSEDKPKKSFLKEDLWAREYYDMYPSICLQIDKIF
jgi:hypothetical protein